MSWETDKEPIDYLKQRVKYYKGKLGRAKNWTKNPIMVEKYGDQLPYMIARSLLRNEAYIAMYKKAIEDLETIEEMENKVTEHKPIKL